MSYRMSARRKGFREVGEDVPVKDSTFHSNDCQLRECFESSFLSYEVGSNERATVLRKLPR
jgi:hypothetical protein